MTSDRHRSNIVSSVVTMSSSVLLCGIYLDRLVREVNVEFLEGDFCKSLFEISEMQPWLNSCKLNKFKISCFINGLVQHVRKILVSRSYFRYITFM